MQEHVKCSSQGKSRELAARSRTLIVARSRWLWGGWLWLPRGFQWSCGEAPRRAVCYRGRAYAAGGECDYLT